MTHLRFIINKCSNGTFTAFCRHPEKFYRADNSGLLWQLIKEGEGGTATHHRRKGVWIVHPN